MPPTATQSTSHRPAARPLVATLVSCAVGALLINTWIVEGLLFPLVVSGGSMAPALVGEHRQWHCDGCRAAFACDLASLPATGAAAVCPHCGAANDPALGADVPGDRMLIDRSAFLWRTPRRWETVAFRSPEDPESLCIKRVVGLPGEAVEIVAGDVFIDGAPVRKSLEVQRAVAVAVSHSETTDRWRGDKATPWRSRDGVFVHDGGKRADVDWLTYHHTEHAIGDSALSNRSILNDSTYDQGESRQLDEVRDVMLCLEVQASGTGSLHLRATCESDDFQVRLEVASGRLELRHNGRVVRSLEAPAKSLGEPTEVELAVADRRVQLAFAGATLLQYDYEPQAQSSDASDQILAIGAQGARLNARHLRVFRDVFYTSPGDPTQYRLGDREYFVLGDNSPHSRDSRSWSSTTGVSERLLLGPAITW